MGQQGTLRQIAFGDNCITLATRATFRIVGIELGAPERLATNAHYTPRIKKALLAGRRLADLGIPAAVTAQMWRTAVLPQALYGCELREIPYTSLLKPLCQQGKQMVAYSAISNYRLAEVCRWGPVPSATPAWIFFRVGYAGCLLLADNIGLVGMMHRALTTDSGPLLTGAFHYSTALATAVNMEYARQSLTSTGPRTFRQEPSGHGTSIVPAATGRYLDR